jgi:hypothetical protein
MALMSAHLTTLTHHSSSKPKALSGTHTFSGPVNLAAGLHSKSQTTCAHLAHSHEAGHHGVDVGASVGDGLLLVRVLVVGLQRRVKALELQRGLLLDILQILIAVTEAYGRSKKKDVCATR